MRPETEVLFREARKALEKERGEKLDDDAVLEALCRRLLAGGRATRDPDSVPRGADAGSVPRGTALADEVRPSSDASAVDEVSVSSGAAPYRVA